VPDLDLELVTLVSSLANDNIEHMMRRLLCWGLVGDSDICRGRLVGFRVGITKQNKGKHKSRE